MASDKFCMGKNSLPDTALRLNNQKKLEFCKRLGNVRPSNSHLGSCSYERWDLQKIN